MRMIDADKLIEEIESYRGDIFASEIVELIEQFPTADVPNINVGKWIPCSERLPEKTGYYLVQLSRKLPNEDYSDIVVVLYNGEDKEFMTYESLTVAWMPLPEPYQPKEDYENFVETDSVQT